MIHSIDSVLGKKVSYSFTYNPEILAREPRLGNREIYGFTNETVPFACGVDVWHAYECTFLTSRGLPVNGILKLVIPADSEFIVESKSLKLYLFSFNMQKLAESAEEAAELFCRTVERDLAQCIGAPVKAGFFRSGTQFQSDPVLSAFIPLESCIDLENIEFTEFQESPAILKQGERRSVQLKTDLLRSSCRITGQPDFGTLYLAASDLEMDLESFAQYAVSFRGENHFHEEIAECIYARINEIYAPKDLLVCALYTRRGGIDICPVRASSPDLLPPVLTDCSVLSVKEYRS